MFNYTQIFGFLKTINYKKASILEVFPVLKCESDLINSKFCRILVYVLKLKLLASTIEEKTSIKMYPVKVYKIDIYL